MNQYLVVSTLSASLMLTVGTSVTGAAEHRKKLQVFILAGQSNMEGQGVVDLDHPEYYNGGKGNLVWSMEHSASKGQMRHLKDADGKWVVRDDVFVRYRTGDGELKKGGLGIGYAVYPGDHHIGPELQFGHVLGDYFEEPVLLIKTCWGGKSLFKDFRPPSAGGRTGESYLQMLAEIREALDCLGEEFPQIASNGYEISGFVWFQGWNDMVDEQARSEYANNLMHLASDVRKALKSPNLPIVIGELGNLGLDASEDILAIRRAQAQAADGIRPKGSAVFVKTAQFARPREQSPNVNHGHHWFGNAESYFLIGDALGKGMKKLLVAQVEARAGVRHGAPKANVVILLTDDQGTLDANCYGSTDLITPNIDRLAATGVRFTQAYAHTVCCPARAALLTGRYPQRGGVRNWTQGDMNAADGINMALEELTLAEALKAAGYRTALFGKWHLGAHRDFGPKKQGFDEFFGIRDGFIDNYNHFFLHGAGFHDLYEGTAAVHADGDYFPELMVQRALRFLDENKDRPFFLYVPFNIPHYPEQPLKQFEELYQDMKDPARRSYGAIVTTTDHYIGRILDKLESLGLRENTIVIFMSDNGHSEETGNRIGVDHHKSGLPKGHFYGASGGGNTGKWIGQKGTFLEGGIRVPAIVSFPGRLPQGEVRGQIVTAMDWFPTVLDFCGIERKADAPKLDGHSLLPIIESADAESQYGGVLHFAWGTDWAVRDGDWKLIGHEDRNSGRVHTTLHNLGDTEPEVKNHAAEQPEIVARLTAMHMAWAKAVAPR